MKKNNPHEKNIESHCSVCNAKLLVNAYGNGEKCSNCGWIEDAASKEIPHMTSPILISLNKARQLYKEGKPFEVEFKDFIQAYESYGEMEFYYNKVRYGLCAPRDKIVFFECDSQEQKFVEFTSLEDFIATANIDGVLLKDLWDKVENPYWLQ